MKGTFIEYLDRPLATSIKPPPTKKKPHCLYCYYQPIEALYKIQIVDYKLNPIHLLQLISTIDYTKNYKGYAFLIQK